MNDIFFDILKIVLFYGIDILTAVVCLLLGLIGWESYRDADLPDARACKIGLVTLSFLLVWFFSIWGTVVSQHNLAKKVYKQQFIKEVNEDLTSRGIKYLDNQGQYRFYPVFRKAKED